MKVEIIKVKESIINTPLGNEWFEMCIGEKRIVSETFEGLFVDFFENYGYLKIGESLVVDTLDLFKVVVRKLFGIFLNNISEEGISKIVRFLNSRSINALYEKEIITYTYEHGTIKTKSNILNVEIILK